jgi:glyoxylase-like metal-dependent hydrolase (beta-lactamase superfamily II)/ferredoxin
VARRSDRRPENTPGDLFVDRSCIACDTCRRIAPAVFGGEDEEQAFVAQQPRTDQDRRHALQALVACPVTAIGSELVDRVGVTRAARSYPEPVEGAPGVYDCGFTSPRSFGAASWLLRRQAGNVLVDSPRSSHTLAEGIAALGGISTLFLTHRDDVADHASWARRFGCPRVLHAADVTPASADVERKLQGEEPVPLGPDLLVVPVPGHTPGSCALLWNEAWLFTGDHLWGDAEGRLGASRALCWGDWGRQLRSLERLLELRFEAVFPGHGRPWRGRSAAHAHEALAALVAELRRDA